MVHTGAIIDIQCGEEMAVEKSDELDKDELPVFCVLECVTLEDELVFGEDINPGPYSIPQILQCAQVDGPSEPNP